MKQAAKLLAAGLVGFFFGWVATSFAWFDTQVDHARLVRTLYQFEQEHLRDQAAARGDLLAEAVHGMNAADAMAGKGFRWLERQSAATFMDRASYPLMLRLLRDSELARNPDKLEKGSRISEALTRGQAALALEELDLRQGADVQWQAASDLAADLDPLPIREGSVSLRQMQVSPLRQSNADAYLRARTDRELDELLDQARETLSTIASE